MINVLNTQISLYVMINHYYKYKYIVILWFIVLCGYRYDILLILLVFQTYKSVVISWLIVIISLQYCEVFCTYVYIYIYINMYLYIYIYICTYMYTYIYTYYIHGPYVSCCICVTFFSLSLFLSFFRSFFLACVVSRHAFQKKCQSLHLNASHHSQRSWGIKIIRLSRFWRSHLRRKSVIGTKMQWKFRQS